MPRHPPSPLAAIPAAYRALFKYLDRRFLDTVTLRFDEIEELIGCPLPDAARRETTWWTDTSSGKSSIHTRAWSSAHRVATVNLEDERVQFGRMPRAAAAATASPVMATDGGAEPGPAQAGDHGSAHRMDDDGGWQPPRHAVPLAPGRAHTTKD